MRYLNGAWVEDADHRAMGPAESSIEMPGDLTLGLFIGAPFGPGTDATLAIRAIDDGEPGGIVTLAIQTLVHRATPTFQNRPHRLRYDVVTRKWK